MKTSAPLGAQRRIWQGGNGPVIIGGPGWWGYPGSYGPAAPSADRSAPGQHHGGPGGLDQASGDISGGLSGASGALADLLNAAAEALSSGGGGGWSGGGGGGGGGSGGGGSAGFN